MKNQPLLLRKSVLVDPEERVGVVVVVPPVTMIDCGVAKRGVVVGPIRGNVTFILVYLTCTLSVEPVPFVRLQ